MIHLIEFRAMGCQINVQLEANEDGALILADIPNQVAEIEARLTRFNPNSELMWLNANGGAWVQVSDILLQNICKAKYAASLTNGLYNPFVLPNLIASGYDRNFDDLGTVQVKSTNAVTDWRSIEICKRGYTVRIPEGSALDLGGIAKGWTANHLAQHLSQYGACLVNMGGDMVAHGSPAGSRGWPIEIEDPFTGQLYLSLQLTNSSIATSGIDYRRWKDTNGNDYHHIIDPRTGQPAQTDVLSVTVIHPHAPAAETFAKAVLMRGATDGLIWLNQRGGASGLLFCQNQSVLATSTFTTLINERNTIS